MNPPPEPTPLVFDFDAMRVARLAAGITQEQLARILDVATVRTVQRWEYGESEPSGEDAIRIAEVLSIDATTLYREREAA